MKLRATIVPVSEITDAHMDAMLELMECHYENVTPEALHQDLREKTWVIILEDDGELRGFSTQALFEHEFDGESVLIVYSGDTIIAPSHWGTWALPTAWVRMVLSIEQRHPGRDIYWLLTTKGYKTYRFLPVFFETYSPRLEGETSPGEQRLVESLVARKFPARPFEARTWTLAVEPAGQRLRGGVADIEEPHRKDPHIRFFEERNPGHGQGDELVCLARCNKDNLKPFIVRRAQKT